MSFEREAEKELKKLDKLVGRRILKVLRRIAGLDDIHSVGEAFKGSKLRNYWEYRVGACRIVADIQNQRLRGLVVRVGKRREVHR